MHIPPWLEKALLKGVDRFYRHRAYSMPGKASMKRCKIISHRGQYDNRRVFENSLAAFDAVMACQIWGIEFDLRWTKDHTPVVFHDSNTRRLFGRDASIHRMRLSDLSISFPAIPPLEKVIQRYGRRVHLMVEIKDIREPGPQIQNQILGRLFSQLRPVADFHLISLDPETFRAFDFLPPAAMLPIAQLTVGRFSRLAQQNNYGGLLGHYALLTQRVIEKHHGLGQRVGTGFVNSASCLFRELNRKVEWIFSDRAVQLQKQISRIHNGGYGDEG
jgi:glycerophosphoryl diester phosphodiesterase